jgi:hypothetical protein
MIDTATAERYLRDANPIRNLDHVDPDELTHAVAAVHTRRAAIMQAPTPTSPVTPSPQRQKVWAFAAAFILILAAVGIATLVARSGDKPSVADEPMAPIDVESLTWSRVPQDEAVFNPTEGIDMMSSVIEGGPGFVAVGSTDWEGDAAVWISEDGISWSLLPNDEPPLGGDGAQWMEAVTAGGPGLVAVGGESLTGPLGSHAVVWTSEDGISWSKISSEVLGSDDPDDFTFWLSDVTVGGPGLVAVGPAYNSTNPEPCGTCGGAVWTSVDGIAWNRLDVDPGLLYGIRSVTAGGPGLVAVGSDWSDEHNPSAAVWTSPDGLIWTRIPHDEAVFGGIGSQGMSDVIAGGAGLVAVGGEEPDIHSAMGGIRAAAWTSPDGFTWTRAPHDADVFGGQAGNEGNMDAVVSIGSEFVAVGRLGSVSPAMWTSVDGMTWTRIQFDASTSKGSDPLAQERWEGNDVIATSTGLMAAGQEDGAAAVWVATED